MLHVGKDSRFKDSKIDQGSVLSPAELVAAWKAFVRRQRSILLVFPLLTAAVALLYLAVATPKFTAEAVLLVELKRSEGATQSSPADLGSVGSAASFIDNQVEILKSEKIAISVIQNLELLKDPEFVGYGRGFIGTAFRLLGLVFRSEDTEFSLTRRALERFERKLTVKRVGLTYAISIQFESPDAERSAEIANAVARAYTADQIEANYESARVATEWLEGRVDVLRGKASDAQKAVSDRKAAPLSTNQAQLELRDLEISAQAYRRLYDTFLQRYLESVEQQSFPASQGRLVKTASPPLRPSSPKRFLILAVSLTGGIFLGLGVAYLRDVSDLTFRTRDRVQAELHIDCIGIVPAAMGGSPVNGPHSLNSVLPGSRTIECSDSLVRNIAENPCSHFSESFRSIKLAIDLMHRGGKRTQVVAITSVLPHEGKSTVAASLAQLMAQGGSRVILLDCDLRNPSLSSVLAPDATLGVLDVTSGRAKLDDVTWIDPATGLQFLPATNGSRLAYPSEVLACEEMTSLFRTLRETYEYVIVDLSPIAPFVDVRTAAHLMDSFVLVIEWGRTNVEVVKKNLDVADDVYGNLIGVILNKANMYALKRYGEALDSYQGRFSQEQGSRK
ncbi:polysaccharide biosynthesis tyrosine autokinase [Bradyrhizobium sp. BWA-3-5]|uniref:polysaccharide biosynthesis tyrosine autokinase n=1 Tax=Bradyrhizobium sp. BWA-3-5 TaxID=3080013 RepID=UPI00293F6976|nr:polysaccharide biosynthesis tyrosine autokinase [Bradyrhizobium sp. BWA-3-5]WOH67871.1 polysaccharide biosynthesis tyrosine autokinase [Bradyrhizobium sp. BWA-3-5]